MLKLNVASSWRLLLIAGLAIALAGCGKTSNGGNPEQPAVTPPASPSSATAPAAAARGTFGVGSCDNDQRVPVPANAAFAMYYDSDGKEIATAPVEILAGTEGNQMCPATAVDEDAEPGFCSPRCTKMIGGRQVCVDCP